MTSDVHQCCVLLLCHLVLGISCVVPIAVRLLWLADACLAQRDTMVVLHVLSEGTQSLANVITHLPASVMQAVLPINSKSLQGSLPARYKMKHLPSCGWCFCTRQDLLPWIMMCAYCQAAVQHCRSSSETAHRSLSLG